MHYRLLGKTGLRVSEIGFGAWGIGGGWGVRDDQQAAASLRSALDRGVNFFDTALAYGEGHSERLIAEVVGESREPAIIATKVPPKNHEWPARYDVSVAEAFPKKWVIRCTERSLKNLRTDCIDLQQLHVWSPRWLAETEWLEALQEMKRQGKVRFIGVSINDHEPDTALDLIRNERVDALQVIYNIFDQGPGDRLFPLARQHGVGILARCPLDEGSLTGSLKNDTVFHPEDWRAEYFRGDRLNEVVKRVGQLDFLIRDEIRTLSQAALKFCLSHPAVSTVIPGMRRAEHLEENCLGSDGRPLTSSELKRLEAHRWQRNFYAG